MSHTVTRVLYLLLIVFLVTVYSVNIIKFFKGITCFKSLSPLSQKVNDTEGNARWELR